MENLYIVCSGIVHVRRKTEKGQTLLGRIEPGGFFGEVNLLDPGTATASIFTMGATTVAFVDYATLRCFMEQNPSIGYKIVSSLMKEVCVRLRSTSNRYISSVFWGSQK